MKLFSFMPLTLSAIAALCAATAVHAGDLKAPSVPPTQETSSGEQSMNDAWFTGPLVASNATSNEKGHWLIEPYFSSPIKYGSFNNDWSTDRAKHNSYTPQSTWLIEYGVTDQISVEVVPAFGYGIGHDNSSSNIQFGDFKALLQYTLHRFKKGEWLPTIAIAVAEIFPTGQYDQLGNHPGDGFGMGSFQTELALWTQDYFWLPNGRILRTRFNFTTDIPTGNIGVRDASVYGTDNGFRGHANLGNQYKVDLSFEYSLTSRWVPVIEFYYAHSDRGQISGIQRTASGMVHLPANGSPSTEYFEIDPAIEYNFNSNIGIIAGAQIAVTGRNSGATVIPQFAVNMYF
jgi:hypothetical protein